MKQIQFTKQYTKEKYNIWYETVKEVSIFMGEPMGKWQKTFTGWKHYEIADLLKEARTGRNPRAYMNHLLTPKDPS